MFERGAEGVGAPVRSRSHARLNRGGKLFEPSSRVCLMTLVLFLPEPIERHGGRPEPGVARGEGEPRRRRRGFQRGTRALPRAGSSIQQWPLHAEGKLVLA